MGGERAQGKEETREERGHKREERKNWEAVK